MWTTGVVGGVAAVCLLVLLALLILRRRNHNKASGPLSHHDGMPRYGSFTSAQGSESLAGRLSAALGTRGMVRDSSSSHRHREEPLVITGSTAWSGASHLSSELDSQAGTRVLHQMSTSMVGLLPQNASSPRTFWTSAAAARVCMACKVNLMIRGVIPELLVICHKDISGSACSRPGPRPCTFYS